MFVRWNRAQPNLDKAIADYAGGNALQEHCLSKLAEAKLKVEQINVKADGTITTKGVRERVGNFWSLARG